MSAFMPLLLLSQAIFTQDLSIQETKLVKNAVTATNQAHWLDNFIQQCDAAITGELPKPDLPKLEQLIQQKLYIQAEQLQELYPEQTNQIKPINCQDTDAYLDSYDRYELATFSVEIALALTKQPAESAAQNDIQQEAKIKSLLKQSHSIARVSVIQKSELTALEQAQYLHFNYSSDYIFKIQGGWNALSPRFVGMHITLSGEKDKRRHVDWLILLDRQNHFVKAVQGAEAQSYQKHLGKMQWRYTPAGDLMRERP